MNLINFSSLHPLAHFLQKKWEICKIKIKMKNNKVIKDEQYTKYPKFNLKSLKKTR